MWAVPGLRLEEQLNRPLFIRKRNGVELTSGGQRLHPHALTVVFGLYGFIVR